jgi:hypothetical protein
MARRLIHDVEGRHSRPRTTIASHEPPTSILLWLASQGQCCQLSPHAGPGMRMSEPSQGRSRDDSPNHQDCAQTSQILGVQNNHLRSQATEPPTIYPNGFRAAAGADPAYHACMNTSTCVWHSLPSLSLASMIKVVKSWGFVSRLLPCSNRAFKERPKIDPNLALSGTSIYDHDEAR